MGKKQRQKEQQNKWLNIGGSIVLGAVAIAVVRSGDITKPDFGYLKEAAETAKTTAKNNAAAIGIGTPPASASPDQPRPDGDIVAPDPDVILGDIPAPMPSPNAPKKTSDPMRRDCKGVVADSVIPFGVAEFARFKAATEASKVSPEEARNILGFPVCALPDFAVPNQAPVQSSRWAGKSEDGKDVILVVKFQRNAVIKHELAPVK